MVETHRPFTDRVQELIHQNSQVSADIMTQESSTIKIFHCFWIIKDFSVRFIFNRQNSK